jgi:uncharacterized protein
MNSRKFLILFVILAYALSWAVWLWGLARLGDASGVGDERFAPYLLAGSFGPTVAALAATYARGGGTAVTALLKRLIQIKAPWAAYLFIFLALPTAGIGLHLLAGVPAQIPLWQIGLTMLPLAPLNALFGGIIFGYGPLGEEMGWRGVMQEELGPVNVWTAALLIGAVWSGWHLPLFQFADFRAGLDLLLFAPLYTLSLILASATMGHIWRWTGGSLFAAIFYHAMINITAARLTDGDWWDLAGVSNLGLYGLIVGAFLITAVAAELLNRTYFAARRG